MLQGYKGQQHSRFTNCLGLWNEVHITSVLPPELVYQKMVSENRDLDSLQQLKRRITTIVYHWQNEKGQFKSFELPMNRYKSYDDLKHKALGSNGFINCVENETPFN
jgi:hypothetical protein